MPRISQRILALDTETTGIDLRHGCKPFMVSMQDHRTQYPWFYEWRVDPKTREPEVDYQDLNDIQRYIDEADLLILQNTKFDVRALDTVFLGKLRWPWEKVRDTLLAGHILESNGPHDLTSMALVNLGVNIQAYENLLKDAVQEARRIVKQKYPSWRLASKDLPEMPSAKEKVGSYDYWLPRAVALAEKYPKDHPWSTVCSDYGAIDAQVTFSLWKAQEAELKKRKLWKVYLERLKLLPVIYRMESRGVTISRARTVELQNQMGKSSTRLQDNCIRISGGTIEALPKNGTSNALKEVLFNQLRLVSPKRTPKDQPSVDRFVLDEWMATLPQESKAYEFIRCLRGYRRRQTALGYIESYRKFWLPLPGERDWCVLYPSVNPTGTDTLRMSSSNPNEQQISKQGIALTEEDERTGKGKSARYMFGPAPGREWWSMDYENIELRIPAYESGEQAMIDLFEKPNEPPYFGSNHLLFFDILHHEKFIKPTCPKCLGKGCTNEKGKKGACGKLVPLCEIKGGIKKVYGDTWYQWTKNGDFAVQYGAVAESGTADRAYHVPGAQAKIESHLKNIKKLSTKMIKMANEKGYIETMPDKTVDPKHGYPLLCTRTRWGSVLPTVPLSYHVQGTACWAACKAMVRCDEYLADLNRKYPKAGGYYMIMNVHDELVFDFPKSRGTDEKGRPTNEGHALYLKELMEMSGKDIGVPLSVSVSYHPHSWSD